jgi:hypothetical protein
MATAKRAGTSVSGGKLWHVMDRGVLIGTVNSVMGMFMAHPFGAKERAHDSLKDATSDVARRYAHGRTVSRRNPITVPTFSAPHIPERRVLRYAEIDGEMFATNMGNGFPRTFATADEAADSIRDLSWRPGYWEGPFRVEPVVVSQYRIAGDWITQRVIPIGRGKAKKNPRQRGRRA